jgi:hypothetical protein
MILGYFWIFGKIYNFKQNEKSMVEFKYGSEIKLPKCQIKVPAKFTKLIGALTILTELWQN